MDTARNAAPRCTVYLHPAAASNPSTIRNIQHTTGQVVVLASGRPRLTPTPKLGPFGGDAA